MADEPTASTKGWELCFLTTHSKEVHVIFKHRHINTWKEFEATVQGECTLSFRSSAGERLTVPAADLLDMPGAGKHPKVDSFPDDWRFVLDLSRNFFEDLNLRHVLEAVVARLQGILACDPKDNEGIRKAQNAISQVAPITVQSVVGRLTDISLTSNYLKAVPTLGDIVYPRLQVLGWNHNHVQSISRPDDKLDDLSVMAPNLRHLDMSYCRLADVSGLPRYLGNHKQLEFMSLSCNRIESMQNCLPSLRSLTTLGLFGNLIFGISGKAENSSACDALKNLLGQIRHQLPRLESLYVQGNPGIIGIKQQDYQLIAKTAFPYLIRLDGQVCS